MIKRVMFLITLACFINATSALVAIPDTIRVCGDSTVLHAVNGYTTYQWNTGASGQSLTVRRSGLYIVTKTGGPFTGSDSTYVSILKAKVIEDDTTICKGTELLLHLDSGFTRQPVCDRTQLPLNLQLGLSGFYPFCNNLKDASINSNNGIMLGSLAYAFDRFNNALSAIFLPGTANAYINVPYNVAQNSNVQSWSFWIYLTQPLSTGNGAAMISKAKEDGSCEGVTVFESNGGLYSQLKMCTPDGHCNAGVIGTGWHHLVLMFQPGGNSKFYVDGVHVYSDPLTPLFQFAPGLPFRFGRSHDPYWEDFHGYMDDIAIYNRLLSDAEVKQLYQLRPAVSWSTGDTTFTIKIKPDTTTSYFVTVSDGVNTCFDTIKIIVNSPITQSMDINGCDSVIWNSDVYYSNTVIADTVKSIKGCDSVYRTINITVNAAVKPTIQIIPSSNPACAGTTVSFTANITNGGNAPSLFWKLNGNTIASGTVFSSASLVNGDIIRCILNSNAMCASPQADSSGSILMIINPNNSPGITITASAVSICRGTSVTFSALALNGGNNPVYQWKLNGNNVAANSAFYVTDTLKNNDVVSCVLLSNASCISSASAQSNILNITVQDPVTPFASIAAVLTEACEGTNLVFTATAVNGGSNPLFIWRVNGNTVQNGNTASFHTAALSDKDTITCIMFSDLACIDQAFVFSNKIGVTIHPLIVPSLSVVSTFNNFSCAGNELLFIAMPVNGGSKPSYQWKVNNTPVHKDSLAYTTTSLKNKDSVYCIMTSNASGCINDLTATSNAIKVDIRPVPVIIMPGDTSIMEGDHVMLEPILSGNISSLYWLPGYALSNAFVASPLASPLTTTTYRLFVTSPDGCEVNNRITVRVFRNIRVANAFSPNADGINDTWNIPTLADYPGCIVQVFDRYGKLMFESEGYETPWDGKLKGTPLPVGTYYYIIKTKQLAIIKSGAVTILR